MRARNLNLYMPSGTERNFFTDSVPKLPFSRAERVVSFFLPKNFRKDSEADDLPDITPALMSRLKSMWDMDDMLEEKPITVVIESVREHLDSMDPYLETLKDHQRGWYDCWRFLYKIAGNLDNVAEESAGQRFYTVPEDLRMEELRARMNLGKDELDFKNAQDAYITEIDRRREELVLLGNQIQEITDAQDLPTLEKFRIDSLHGRAVVQDGSGRSPGCLTAFFSLFPCKRKQAASVAPAEISPEVRTDALENLRAQLLTRYNDDLRFKTGMFNDFAESAPTRPDNYRSAWNEIKAKIYHDRLEFDRCQSKEVMLQCIRLYVLAFRTYYLIYGDDPLAMSDAQVIVSQKRIKKIYDEKDQVVFKVQDLFRQLIQNLKDEFSRYYCLQPSRREFSVYLDNYNNIAKSADRDAILAGTVASDDDIFSENKSMEDLVNMVFDDFETPEEAFEIPRQKI